MQPVILTATLQPDCMLSFLNNKFPTVNFLIIALLVIISFFTLLNLELSLFSIVDSLLTTFLRWQFCILTAASTPSLALRASFEATNSHTVLLLLSAVTAV